MKLDKRLTEDFRVRPFFIGLIGHRLLAESEVPKIQEAFDNFLAEILSLFKFTPIVILTSMAEGADRLIFHSRYRDSVKICGILPLNFADLVKDFSSGSARKEFQELLDQTDYLIEFGSKQKSKSPSKSERNRAYKECANWISDKSNSLFVVWDGKSSKGVGGTAGTINYRVKNVEKAEHLGRGGISLVHVAASNGSRQPNRACNCDGHQSLNSFDIKNLKELDLLNSFLAKSQNSLIDNSTESHFQLFDFEAVHLQKRIISKTKSLLVLGVVSVNLASAQLDLLNFWVLLASLFLLGFTTTSWFNLNKTRTKHSYETFRLIAEVLRVALWWEKVGLKENVLSTISEIREVNGASRLLISNTFSLIEIYRFSSQHNVNEKVLPREWIEGQKNYLRSADGSGAIQKHRLKSLKLKKSIYASISIAGLVMLLGTSFATFFGEKYEEIVHWFTSLTFSLSLSVAAAVAAFGQVMSHDEIYARYEIKNLRLDSALRSLKDKLSARATFKIVRDVGRDSIVEAFRWFQTKSEREVRPFQ